MNREQELAKLAQLEKEVADLRAMLEKPEVAGSLLFKPNDGDAYWMLERYYFGALKACSDIVEPKFSYGGNCFQTEKIARAYVDAIDTMLLLRHQPGTVSGELGASNWFIGIAYATGKIRYFESTGYHIDLICPAFSTEEAAKFAVSSTGEKRVMRMFKTFHGIYE